jgi:hypothetical protein
MKTMETRHQLHKWQGFILFIFWDKGAHTQWTITIWVIHNSELLHRFLQM